MQSCPLFLGIIGLLSFQPVSAISSDFYPFGISRGDIEFPPNDDGSSPKVSISSLFPYFNNQHNSLYVNTNGAISFQKVITQYTPQPFPLSDGRRVIAPFWADVDIRNGGTVWYRESTNPDLLGRATQEVKLYYPSQTNFHATWIFIATWDDVAFYGASQAGLQKRNTFQAVLITNGRHSFTVFNYDNITWTTGTASDGNSDTGLGGTPAQVGFNGGDGVNFFVVNQSRSADIVNLTRLSNVNVPGKFVFRIDTANIESGGCNTEGTVTVTPRYIPMFGGKLITVAGPCIDSNDTAKISFDSETPQLCVRRTAFSVKCSTPIFYKTGDVTVNFMITHADQMVSSYTGVIKLLNPIRITPGLIRVNPQDWKTNNNVRLHLDRQQIPFDANRATLEVWAVKPMFDNGSHYLKYHKTLKYEQDQPVNSFVLDFDIKIAVLRMSSRVEGLTQSVWSDIFHIQPGTNSIETEFCKLWRQSDDSLLDISQQGIQECPCTIDLAIIDVVRFQDDPNCNPSVDNNRQNINCAFNPEAKHCFRLNVPGIQDGFVVTNDANGSLMDARMRNGGGSVHRRHYLGGPGNVPYLSHFVSDVAPYSECCIHGDFKSCRQFIRRRPLGNCENYRPVTFGGVFGDPHITTLDDLSYTFNGVGEFALLITNDNSFAAQVRMEPVKDEDGNPMKGSVVTSFVAKSHNASDTVEVQLNTIRVADVLVNGIQVDFTEANFLEFTEVTVSTTSFNASHGSLKQINVVFKEPPIAFRVLAGPSMLNTFIISGTEHLKGNISGLLGNYNGDPNDDLKCVDGTSVPAESSTEVIHREFGLKWRVNAADTLFTYPRGKSSDSYQDVNFTPLFTIPPASSEAKQICGDDEFCLFDYYTTGNQHIAVSSRDATQTLISCKEKTNNVLSCGFPMNIENGFWNYTGVTINSTAVLSCETGFAPVVEHHIYCMSDGDWSESRDTCEVVECGPPTFTQHGKWLYTETIYNSNATLACNDGYFINESVSISCNSDGLWDSTIPLCKAVSCEHPGTPDNGTWIVSDVIYNSTAELECDTGYSVQNSVTIICQSNGQWTQQTDQCLTISCGEPTAPSHGKWVTTGLQYTATGSIKCEEGYTTNKSGEIRCLGNGSWAMTNAECSPVSCGSPGTPDNGTWIVTDVLYNSTAELVCDAGYFVQNPVSIICQKNGQWTQQTEHCSTVSCGIPETPDNGTWIVSDVIYNSTAELECDAGYSVQNSVTIICQSNAQWTQQTDQCLTISCGEPTAPSHGKWVTTGLQYTATGSIKCEEGYTTNKSGEIRCLGNGSWAMTNAECSPVSCGSPGTPDNGTWIVTDVLYNSTAELVCDAGYSVQNPVSIICQKNGQWTQQTEHCSTVSCGIPETPDNGLWIVSDVIYNSTAELECDAGYSVQNPVPIICQSNAQWTQQTEHCSIVDCGVPVKVQRGLWKLTTTTFGSIVTLECHKGFEYRGGLTFTCLANGVWNLTDIECTENTLLQRAVKQTLTIPWLLGVIVASVVLLGVIFGIISWMVFKQRRTTKDEKAQITQLDELSCNPVPDPCTPEEHEIP